MWEALGQGAVLLVQPAPLLFLVLGVALGILVGLLPGLGVGVSMVVLLPVIVGVPPMYALTMLIGLMALNCTADTIPAIMMGTPPDTASSATVMDGYPLARKGQAARALGAAFSASMLGGVVGAVVLALSVPVAEPLLKQFLSPEFFMLCLLGVTLVGGLTGNAPLKGIFAGGLGLLVSTIGGSPGVGYYRYTFDINYLFNGLPLIAFIMGVMALPEMADLFIKGTQITDIKNTAMRKGMIDGWKDTFRNCWLVMRCSLIGAWIGFFPGVGGSTAAWMAYSHAVTSCRGPKLDKNSQVMDGFSGKYGDGDIRGVIGPESANNATKGGDLIPTLFFGIPGSGSMAIFLAILIIIGIQPGLSMLDPQRNLPLTYSMMWSLAIANIMGTLACSALARPMSRICVIDVHYIVPIIIMFTVYGVWQATQNWGDLVVLGLLSVLGWTMKRMGWPRPPLLIGFVLGGLADQYLWLSVDIFGWTWLWRPWVLGMFAAGIASLWYIVKSSKKKERVDGVPLEQQQEAGEIAAAARAVVTSERKAGWTFKKETIFTLLLAAMALYAFIDATTFPGGSGLYPMVIAFTSFGLALAQAVVEARQKTVVKDTMDVKLEASQRGKPAMRRAVMFLAWLVALYVSMYLFGFQVIILPWVAVLMFFAGHLKWWRVLLVTGLAAILVLWVMPDILRLEPPRGLLQEWLSAG
ncbi:MAG: tripartite tricarboxylate transporter permease [Chloroflexi bacterium]|nr:tripartite tricarboxylate transporter permease [Chloroflexota bacterium]